MPTHDELAQFLREWAKLTPQQQTLFLAAVNEMVTDLRTHSTFRPSLRIKGVQGHPGVFEMTWAPNGRATFTMALRSNREKHTLSGDASAIIASSTIPSHLPRGLTPFLTSMRTNTCGQK